MTTGNIIYQGKRLIVDGKAARHEDCCCDVGESDQPCQHCDRTPLLYKVTLTGLTGPYAADLNGVTVDLWQTGGEYPCYWEGVLKHPVSGTYDYWMWIWTGGGYELDVDYTNPPDPVDPIFQASEQISPLGDCWDGLETPVNNTLPAGGQAAVVRGTP